MMQSLAESVVLPVSKAQPSLGDPIESRPFFRVFGVSGVVPALCGKMSVFFRERHWLLAFHEVATRCSINSPARGFRHAACLGRERHRLCLRDELKIPRRVGSE